MYFPRSKSWVEITWSIADPENFVSGMSAEVNLAAEGPRTLVDFGAGSGVYAALRPGQQASLRGRYLRNEESSDWAVNVGGEAYASGRSKTVEGWVHVMDAQRATAGAIAEFGRASADGDRIEAASDGRLSFQRARMGGDKKQFRFWLHFVSMPVQVGAATSPQAMQSPLIVEW
jgi:hypothetical protein